MFTRALFLFFQHNQQHDTLLPITTCTHKLKAGIAYSQWRGQPRDSVHMHGMFMSKEALNKVGYLC